MSAESGWKPNLQQTRRMSSAVSFADLVRNHCFGCVIVEFFVNVPPIHEFHTIRWYSFYRRCPSLFHFL